VFFKGFQLPKVRKKRICQIPIFGFQCVTKYIKGWVKIYTSYLAYSQIWLNLPINDHQFFYIFPGTVAIVTPKEKP